MGKIKQIIKQLIITISIAALGGFFGGWLIGSL
jgi:hypothetical protein